MYLKSLEIIGFKSFAKKIFLVFDVPVTAIVGPNGSGKSNIVEAFRFVLGEQSIKSLRGKFGSDLIFAGSKNLSRLNRASVSVFFNNSDRKFIFQVNKDKKINLDFDEIILTREVYGDGLNRYLINGSEVRLKDIIEILAGVNIGSSGHHIISQGEADRILNSSNKDRRSIIEDALGLRIYQYQLRESEKKLEKTKINNREVEISRKEIAPHLFFLKKQIEKIEKLQELKNELNFLYKEYFKNEEIFLNQEKEEILKEKGEIEKELLEIEKNLEQKDNKQKIEGKGPVEIESELLETKIKNIQITREELSRKLGKVEAMVEINENQGQRENVSEKKNLISFSILEERVREISSFIDEALEKESLREVISALYNIKSYLKNILPKKEEKVVETSNNLLENFKKEKEAISREINFLTTEEQKLYSRLLKLKEEAEREMRTRISTEKKYFELEINKNNLVGRKNLIDFKRENLLKKINSFTDELKEATVLVGSEVLAYKNFVIDNIKESFLKQEERKKKLEKLKIKLEDAGVGDFSVIHKEYQETLERDNFLKKEIEDLTNSLNSLSSLIIQLRAKIESEFKIGIEKINKQFNDFFGLMFDGGSASLALVEIKKKNKEIKEETEEEDNEEEENDFGVEVSVSLPRKKIKELNMLSGGERSLTSIALLFAISQINPPPFLILDETDAALDESNSRKYGEMLENLSKHSQLIVVTHNRETMSHARVLYGVTMSGEGASRILSIKFDEAVAIAK